MVTRLSICYNRYPFILRTNHKQPSQEIQLKTNHTHNCPAIVTKQKPAVQVIRKRAEADDIRGVRRKEVNSSAPERHLQPILQGSSSEERESRFTTKWTGTVLLTVMERTDFAGGLAAKSGLKARKRRMCRK
ncbi:hypothetical protein CEXT_439101 [Caerostris extrusa]|uniref:Uncharacterized protein n=1 Tax=Caerostris extrusa TaxID=172846 RepID=A0AAV4N2V2_CAEEX|nr:hypothetical protein CEXT_439101 [Caerostris extrusa]